MRSTITAGNGVVELLGLPDAHLTCIQAETHTSASPCNPTSPPLNLADDLAQQTQLQGIKG